MIGLWIPLAAGLALFGDGEQPCAKEVTWEASPERAAERAAKEGKLLFIVHLSGVFDNADRTWNAALALRIGALRDPRVVALLSSKFRCAWKKVGTFTVVEDRGVVVEKQGGSVAAYFATSDGRVLGAALGAVNAGFFLEEATWAVRHAGRISPAAHAARAADLLKDPTRGDSVFGWGGFGGVLNGVTVHTKLAKEPLPRLEDVAREFFEKILGQKLSEEPVGVIEGKSVTR